MKKLSNENIILISLVLFALVLILVDYLLNKRGILKESFEDFDYNQAYNNQIDSNQQSYENPISQTSHIKSIVSKYTGKVLNVEANGEPPSSIVTMPFFNEKSQKMNLSVNMDGTYSIVIPNKNSTKQQFLLIFIDSAETYAKHIPLKNENLGYNINEANYPFYILKSHYDITKALQYQDGVVMIRPLANYDSQKWDISYDKIEGVIGTHKKTYESKLSGDFRANPDELGSNEYGDLDKIKIKLNLDNQVLNQFLEKNLDKLVSMGGNNTDDESVYDVNQGKIDLGSSCPIDTSYGNKVPPQAVASLCPGCNPNKL